jgi:hypothetical protein
MQLSDFENADDGDALTSPRKANNGNGNGNVYSHSPPRSPEPRSPVASSGSVLIQMEPLSPRSTTTAATTTKATEDDVLTGGGGGGGDGFSDNVDDAAYEQAMAQYRSTGVIPVDFALHNELRSLRSLLASPLALRRFRECVCADLSLEHLLFYQQVEKCR